MTEQSRFRFERLEVWQKSMQLAGEVYRATSSFPDHERFGLTSQIRRSAISISSNIAEGSGRTSDSEFARYLEIAYGSLMEVVSQAYLARQENYLDESQFQQMYQAADELGRMLSGFRKTLRRQ